MLRLSKLTDYAIVLLTAMANDKNQIYTATGLATSTGIALPTVTKLLKVLLGGKVLMSIRGAKGGYMLARVPEKINVAEVIALLEGPISLTECSLSHQSCGQASGCHMHSNWHLINQAIQQALAAVTLADMARPNPPLGEVHVPFNRLPR
jgi:FeS assembly SUF system regulator